MEKVGRPKVGIIGASSCTETGWKSALIMGAEVARRGGIVISGGLGGIMEAASKGAFEAGGLTVGILPGISDDDANPYIVVPIATGMMHARNTLVVRVSHVLIAVEGGYGTLSEIALALNMGKPVIGLHSWQHIPGVTNVGSPIEAVEKAFEALKDEECS